MTSDNHEVKKYVELIVTVTLVFLFIVLNLYFKKDFSVIIIKNLSFVLLIFILTYNKAFVLYTPLIKLTAMI